MISFIECIKSSRVFVLKEAKLSSQDGVVGRWPLRSLAPGVPGFGAGTCTCAGTATCAGRGQGTAWRTAPGSWWPLCGGGGTCGRLGGLSGHEELDFECFSMLLSEFYVMFEHFWCL